MNVHLSEESWAAAVLDPNDREAAEHLRECPACRQEISSFMGAIAGGRSETLRAADRPESFWREQRAVISTRIAHHTSPLFWKRSAWVAATVILVLVSTTLLSRRNTTSLRPESSGSDPDDVLMMSVQQSIQSDVPQALRPAALLAREINQAVVVRGKSRPTQRQGE